MKLVGLIAIFAVAFCVVGCGASEEASATAPMGEQQMQDAGVVGEGSATTQAAPEVTGGNSKDASDL